MADELRLSDQLTDKLVNVEAALPKDFNRTRFVQNALAVLNDKPELRVVNQAQLVQGLVKAAYLGLDFMNKECYLIPYGNTVQFQTDYRGEVKFVKRYAIRPIKDIYAKVVREGDSFEEKIIDGQATIDFKPIPFSNADIVGVFAVVQYTDGGMEYETMSTEEVNSVRNNYSKASNSKAWKNSWSEMGKKTVLRRLCKHIECDFESVEASKAWEEGGDLDTNVINKPIQTETVNAFADEKVVEITDDVVEIVEDDMPDFLKGDK